MKANARRIPPKSFDLKNRSVPAVARAGGAPSDARAHLDIDRMTASMDVTELSPTALAAEDASPSLDDVLGFRSAQKPSFEDGVRRENEATTTRSLNENEEDACVANDTNDTQDDVAPCCQRTGPCAWDAVCRTHVRRWEAAHGEAYLGFLTRTGGVVPAWLRSAEDGGDALPGQRGSAEMPRLELEELEVYASDENDDEQDTGLLGNGGDDALVEVAGRGEADGEPTPFGADSVMDLDDDDDASAFENPVLAEAMARGSDARAEAAGALRLDETAGLEA